VFSTPVNRPFYLARSFLQILQTSANSLRFRDSYFCAMSLLERGIGLLIPFQHLAVGVLT